MSAIALTLPSLRAAYAAGTSPREIVEQVFAGIAAVADPAIFIHLLDKAEVLAAADALGAYDPTRPLWGVPYVIKDNIDAAGKPTTAACPAYEYVAAEDAFVVAQLRAAGALLIGKTNLDQFATGLVGVRSPYGVPRNSIDPAIVPGGSSGGSGVAVGHGLVTFSLGTDTAGSGRVPAALNNIVGLKPTLGTLSASGVVPACRTLDTISIFALTVTDAYAVFSVASAYDASDAYARRFPTRALTAAPARLRVGIPDAGSVEFFGDSVQADSFARSVDALRQSGAEIVEIDFAPLYAVARMLYEGAWVAERYTVIEDLLKTNPDAIHPVTRKIITAAEQLSAADAFRGIYRLAELKRLAEPALAGVDLLCVPTIPTFYSVADLAADPIGPNSRLGTYTNFVNLLDMCGIAVPAARRSDGRPGSVTLLAPAGADGLVAAVAQGLERHFPHNLGATDWGFADAAPMAPAIEADEMEIAVCGAHMTGLPLNGQLTSRKGRFLRAVESAPEYRFYALAGGPPKRPGMVRVSSGGSAIKMEIWALPRAAFGDFVAGIPSPLGIGSVVLADGSSVKGFICEAIGAEGATDISHLGDWRAFLAQQA
ncbi:allophanate hydrolase [Devosia sp. FKR38]|uniref:allophanate hydrolase n=1 Tax=Devosia sp. FKR38 TaxID=2562312 RepID=UPI0010C0BD07|nr:allophanate hydrolase [Devosia sp. FKR38]